MGSVATPCASSSGVLVAIQEVGQRLLVLCLGFVDPSADGAGELPLGGGGLAGLLALAQDLADVGVARHVVSFGMQPV